MAAFVIPARAISIASGHKSTVGAGGMVLL